MSAGRVKINGVRYAFCYMAVANFVLKIPEMRGEEFLSAEVHGKSGVDTFEIAAQHFGVSTSEESHADFLIDFALDASS